MESVAREKSYFAKSAFSSEVNSWTIIGTRGICAPRTGNSTGSTVFIIKTLSLKARIAKAIATRGFAFDVPINNGMLIKKPERIKLETYNRFVP
jgi:hypothetical protein